MKQTQKTTTTTKNIPKQITFIHSQQLCKRKEWARVG